MGRLFGTNGVRGVYGETMTEALAERLGRAVATTMKGPSIVCADTRVSGPALKAAFVRGLAASGADVVDGGVAPTPALQYAVKTGEYASGAVITASHNPPEFNGIKVVERDGTEASAATEARIEDAYFADRFSPATAHAARLATDDAVVARYVDAVVSHVDAEAIRRARLKFVLDCANGAGALAAPLVLARLGVQVISLNAHPDGTFPGHPSEPTPDNVRDTLAVVPAVGAAGACILDGDADRCVLATHAGGYVPGERSLALAAVWHVKENGGGTVVTPVSSSKCVEDAVVEAGGRVEYTAVGSPVVARAMMRSGAAFGGEENGGLIFPRHQFCRDGTMTAAWACHAIATSGRSLATLLQDIPQYTLIKTKLPCPDAAKAAVLKTLADALARDGGGKINITDGVRIDRPDGWVLVRPSGTEPLFRVFAEARDEATAQRLSKWGQDHVRAAMARPAT